MVVVGSSGCSTGPHLHLEVYDADAHLIDPYSGDCNALNPTSWWEEQPANRTPRINVLLTHDVVPEHGCPTVNEDPHFQNDFYPGDIVYTASYFHDELAGSETIYTLIDANWMYHAEYTGETIVHNFNYGVYAALNHQEIAPIVLSPNPSNGRI